MTNRWIASYEMADDGDYLEHYGRLGMKWGQHIFAKDPAKGRKYIDKKRKALSANVALAKDAARRGNAKRLAQLNKKTKKMVADVKQLEEMYEQATGQKYSSSRPGEAEDAVAQTKQTSKESILKTGSAKDVFAIKDQLTQSELQDAINRIQKENTLESLITNKRMEKLDSTQKFVNTVIGYGNTAVNAFNTYEKVAKMTNDITGQDTLPIFTGKKESADKEKEKKRAKEVKEMIKRGDPKEIFDNINNMTSEEVQEASKRLSNIKTIESKIKHSDLDILEVDDYLEHSGRKGMKWYQHIFGKESTTEKKETDNRTVKEKIFPRMSKVEKKVLNKVNEKAPVLLLPGKLGAKIEKEYFPTFYKLEKKLGTIVELNSQTKPYMDAANFCNNIIQNEQIQNNLNNIELQNHIMNEMNRQVNELNTQLINQQNFNFTQTGHF